MISESRQVLSVVDRNRCKRAVQWSGELPTCNAVLSIYIRTVVLEPETASDVPNQSSPVEQCTHHTHIQVILSLSGDPSFVEGVGHVQVQCPILNPDFVPFLCK